MSATRKSQHAPLLAKNQAGPSGVVRYGTTMAAPVKRPAVKPTPVAKTFKTYLVVFSTVALFLFSVELLRARLPNALLESYNSDEFAGQHAWDAYLSKFCTEPHSGNTKQSLVVHDMIMGWANSIREDAAKHGVTIEVVRDNVTFAREAQWEADATAYFYQSSNVLVRLHGAAHETDTSAFLLSAHYDSVSSSNGVTDDGMGIASMLEVLRTLAKDPPKHDIIFNFNNHEEGGLLGAAAFMCHPWASDVKGFLNLEGAGAGGHAALFRGSNYDVNKLFASASPNAYGNVIGNDVFKAGLIKSTTDFSVYSMIHGIPGLDVAFYSKRSHYHSIRDTLEYTTPRSLQQMGQTALRIAKAAGNNDDLFKEGNQAFGPSVYYDVLGHVAIVYSFTTYQIINFLGVFAGIVLAGYGLYKSPSNMRLGASFKIMRSTLAAFVSFIFSIAFGLGAAYLGTRFAPLAIYGNAYVCMVLVGLATFTGSLVAQSLYAALESAWINPGKTTSESLTVDIRSGLVGFWWLMTILSIVAGFAGGLGSFYWVIWFFAGSLAAFAVREALARDSPVEDAWSMSLEYVIEAGVGTILIFDLVPMALDGLRHTLADGSAEIVVYGFITIITTIVLMPLLPAMHQASNYTRVIPLFVILFVLLLQFIAVRSPYNTTDSPNKVMFRQVYNITTQESTVSLRSGSGVEQVLLDAVGYDSLEWKSRQCETANHLNICSYPTKLKPKVFEDADSTGKPELDLVLDVPKFIPELNMWRSEGSIATQESASCRFDFDTIKSTNDGEQDQFKPIVESFEVDDIGGLSRYSVRQANKSTIPAVVVIRRDFGKPYHFAVEYSMPDGTAFPGLRANLTCYYDEWWYGGIPAYTQVRNSLADDVVLGNRGYGIVAAVQTIQLLQK